MRLLLASVLCLALAASAQQSPLAPHSMYEPPMAAAAATLAASSANVPADLLTTGEKTQWRQTAHYDEAVAIMRRLEKLSPQVKVMQFGTTAQGRAMYMMIVSSDKAFTPAAAAKTNKAVILIQSGIHSAWRNRKPPPRCGSPCRSARPPSASSMPSPTRWVARLI